MITLQVKFSRDFLPIMTLEIPVIRKLRSCTWFTLDKDKLGNSIANRWVFVLLGVERGTDDYVIVKPNELLTKLKKESKLVLMVQNISPNPANPFL